MSANYIGSCCLGKRKTAYEYIWKYEYFDKIEPVKLGHKTTIVYQYALTGEFIKKWDSITEAANEVNGNTTNISFCCEERPNYNTAYGYIWKYEKYDSVSPIIKESFNQYDFNGNYIKTFNTMQEAYDELGYKRIYIKEACEGKIKQAGGYMWSYEKKDRIEPYKKEKKPSKLKKKIKQYTKDGIFIQEWDSIIEARKSVCSKSGTSIINCLKGRNKTAYGYKWKYSEEDYAESGTEL